MTDNITLPRSVVEQALEALDESYADTRQGRALADALRAALEQPQDHVADAGNMVPTGWRLVPVEPTDDMLYDIQEFSHILPPRGKRIWAHMLAAAPQPPTTEQSSAVQPQVEQEPVAWLHADGKHQPLYTHPQPPRQPLTVGQINRLIADGKLPLSGNPYEVARAIERAHGIGGEA